MLITSVVLEEVPIPNASRSRDIDGSLLAEPTPKPSSKMETIPSPDEKKHSIDN
ncbi:uncharacterized protein PHALS_00525 [Plasmopara halstedii]|uniref:Uncharacterized protein n=1 Tax=Plasmopara halstedii TaxID=4781 RepID=A0A0P1A7F5_PLAHL|nr:uncharacterized protein PHALS_00525 [Plasmopara halstedii]CEG36204.1 hypothetical protein PHALS_00525 [Plasmopara halstedii]|eukprot:XP_024572573.1 hypothetical protein PHALS_00525 [Plasmopara halstedii]